MKKSSLISVYCIVLELENGNLNYSSGWCDSEGIYEFILDDLRKQGSILAAVNVKEDEVDEESLNLCDILHNLTAHAFAHTATVNSIRKAIKLRNLHKLKLEKINVSSEEYATA